MPTFQSPRSLVVQFQEDVYKNVGASEILPHLMKCLDADKILAAQLLRAGKVRLTFEDPEVCSAVLRNGLELEGLSVQLMPADDRLRCVHLRDLPVEVDNDVVSSFLSRYGEVLSVDHCYFDDFPSLRNGNRLVKILLAQDIPSFVRVGNCECRVWYPRQPPQCSICREFGHRAPACPLSGLCRRCRQPGHVARVCTQAWGPSVSVFRPASDGSSDEFDHAMEQSSPSPSIVGSVPVSAQSTHSSVSHESGLVMEELACSSPKASAVSASVSVPAQSVTVSAAPAKVTVSASPVTVPVSAIVSVAPVTVTAPAPATVTASSAMITASVPIRVTAPVPTSSSGIVPTSQVSVTPSTASCDHDFPKFSGDQDTVDSKSRAYTRKCMTKEISGVDIDVLRTWSSKNTAHCSSWIIKNYNVPERFKGFSLEMAGHLGKEFKGQ